MSRTLRIPLAAVLALALATTGCGGSSADGPQGRFDNLVASLRSKMDVADYVSADGFTLSLPDGTAKLTAKEASDEMQKAYGAEPGGTLEITSSTLTVIEDQGSFELAVKLTGPEYGGKTVTVTATGTMVWKRESGVWKLRSATLTSYEKK